jgi:uncharacterized membrane protein/protein-disulfide isomerase
VSPQKVTNAAIAILSLLAAVLAAFLLWNSLSGAQIPGCGGGSGCDSVLSSRFSRIGPIPVSALALPVFLTMGILAPRDRPRLLPALAILAAGAAIWFISIQAFILHRFCAYCTVTHALALAASILIFWQWSRSQIRTSPLPAVLAVVLLVAIIAAQLLIQPTLYTITPATQPSTEPTLDTVAPATEPSTQPSPTVVSPATQPSTQRSPSLQVNRMTINPDDWPILGSRDAKHRVILLFDYTCPHCRREYLLLQQARQRYGNQIAFIAIPVPLEPACNPAIPRVIPENINSCTYTRYALAVFLADPSRFEEFHNRVMEGEKPLTLEQTRQIAESLVTPRAFAAALANPAIEKHIKDSVQIYREARAGQIPKLILPTVIIHGEIYPAQRMFDVLEHYLDVKPLR